MSKNRRHRKLAAYQRRKARSQAQQNAKRKEHTERQAATERTEAATQAQTEDSQQTQRINRAARRFLKKSKRPKLRLAKDPTKDRTYMFLGTITGMGVSALVWACTRVLDASWDKDLLTKLIISATVLISIALMSFGSINFFLMRRREQIEAIEALSEKEADEADKKASEAQKHQDDHDLNQSQQVLYRALTRLTEALLKLL